MNSLEKRIIKLEKLANLTTVGTIISRCMTEDGNMHWCVIVGEMYKMENHKFFGDTIEEAVYEAENFFQKK